MTHKAKDDFKFGISKPKREIIQEYKGLKPKRGWPIWNNRTSASTLRKQTCLYENTLEKRKHNQRNRKHKNTHIPWHSHIWNPRMKTMVTKTIMAKNHGDQEPIAISRSIPRWFQRELRNSMTTSTKKSHRETHTHTPEAYDDFKHGISKPKETKTTFKAMTDMN
jgi:hypothetical protein